MKLEKLKGRGCEYLFRHPIHKTIYFRRFTSKLGEVTQSLRTSDLAMAKEKRDKILRSDERAVAPGRQRQTAWEHWQSWVKRKTATGASRATLLSIDTSGKYFEPFFKDMMPEDAGAAWWEATFIPQTGYLGIKQGEWVRRSKLRKFFNNYKWLNNFLKDLHHDGIISKLPRLKCPDPRRSVGKIFTDEEISDLLNFAQNKDLHLAILMASTMGMRRGEIFGLKSAQVDTVKHVIHLKREDTKTRKARSFAISPGCVPLLSERVKLGSPWIFPSKTDPNKPLHKDGFTTAWKNLKRITGAVGRFHDLRHTFLTKAFGAPGANPALICHYAGLSLEVAERVYLHLKEDDSKQISRLVSYDV